MVDRSLAIQLVVLVNAFVRAGANLRLLNAKSFKASQHVYWCTAREADDCLWLVVLKPTHSAVKEFGARSARGTVPPNNPWVMHVSEVLEHWLGLFGRDVHSAEQRGDRSRAGAAHPLALLRLSAAWPAHAR